MHLYLVKLVAKIRKFTVDDKNQIYKAQFCLHVRKFTYRYVRFNLSKITGSTYIKLGTIDHHLEIGVIREFVTL